MALRQKTATNQPVLAQIPSELCEPRCPAGAGLGGTPRLGAGGASVTKAREARLGTWDRRRLRGLRRTRSQAKSKVDCADPAGCFLPSPARTANTGLFSSAHRRRPKRTAR